MTPARILVVDDEAVNRRLLDSMLCDDGYEVIMAADGHAALEILQTQPVDLVLLDVMMPAPNGLEVCATIRGKLGLSHLPVVFVTALADRESRIRCKEVGGDDVLTKPVDDVELIVRVRSLLRLKAEYDEKERQRRLMSTILDTMTEGVVAADGTGFTLWNAAAEHMLGPQGSWPEPTAWPGSSDVITRAGRSLAGGTAALGRALAGEATVEQRIRFGGPGTAARHLAINAQPIGAGATGGAVTVFRDVTELVELDQYKHEMTSLVVHDLKNVMMIIGANVDYALEVGDQTNDELRDSLGDARDAAARALRLIANLMDVARLENSAIELHTEPTQPDQLCRGATKHRTNQLRARSIELGIDAAGVRAIDVDAELIGRVLDNILDNAVRYTPAGGRIAVAAVEVGDGRIQLRIGNTGAPIPVEDRGRIFDKYGQSAAGSPRDGKLNAGLGLYFCRLAVAAHGGRIWVESTPELATVFVIELPAATAGERITGKRTMTIKLAV